MEKPLIGISVDCEHDPEEARTHGKLTLNWNYAEAVVKAGGIPILIPPMADMDVIATMIDGWLIPGGDDIDASNFGQENHPAATLQDPARFEGESRLYNEISPELPVLGICYGCQFLNVKRGGDLIQNIPDIETAEVHTGGVMQDYQLDQNSLLAKYASTDHMTGKSYHHQAVGRVGEGLKVVASAEDGIIEALEDPSKPFLIGVQWHPERTAEDGPTAELFRNFISKASAYRQSRRG